jgi:hypothetical protein
MDERRYVQRCDPRLLFGRVLRRLLIDSLVRRTGPRAYVEYVVSCGLDHRGLGDGSYAPVRMGRVGWRRCRRSLSGHEQALVHFGRARRINHWVACRYWLTEHHEDRSWTVVPLRTSVLRRDRNAVRQRRSRATGDERTGKLADKLQDAAWQYSGFEPALPWREASFASLQFCGSIRDGVHSQPLLAARWLDELAPPIRGGGRRYGR